MKSLLFILIIGLFSCDSDPGGSGIYTLTVEGYKENFAGYYYIDGEYKESFSGTVGDTQINSYNRYYYEKHFNTFISIKVFANKSNEICTLTVTIWKDDKEVITSTLAENAVYDGTTAFITSMDPVYYEPENDSTTSGS